MQITPSLETLETVVRNITQASSHPVEVEGTRQQIEELSDELKKALVREAFSLRKEKKIERYIQYHQSGLVTLADLLVQKLSPAAMEKLYVPEMQDEYFNLVKFTYAQLEGLLFYIEKHFVKYFNLAGKTPESYRFMVYRELKHRLPDIRYALEKKGMNKRLLSIVLYPLDSFVSAVQAQEVSYRRIIYLRGLITELELLATNRLTGRRLDYRVCLSMGYLNYNSVRFYKYCVREITTLVQDQETLSRQIEKLAFFMKVVNQQHVKPGFVYNEKHVSLREQLSSWLGEELVFLEKRQQLSINFPANANDPAHHDFRLKLNLSVAQLACLIRGLKDTGVISNNNVLELIRFFAGVSQTKNTAQISWESLRSKYYNMESSARDSVKDIGIGLFNYLRKNGNA